MTTNNQTGDQSLAISHLDESTFVPQGLRSHNVYRDLGVATVTDRKVKAHVVRAAHRPAKESLGGRHKHILDFQFVYLLKGWQTMRFGDRPEVVTMRAGSSWIQPAGMVHEVLDYSEDREALEITMPADYETVEI